ncbi:MAG: hypothetical protein OEW11_03955 [Nitrospirota bacterium]|nr:hypothetical protein [Nitrospirota bacterium]
MSVSKTLSWGVAGLAAVILQISWVSPVPATEIINQEMGDVAVKLIAATTHASTLEQEIQVSGAGSMSSPAATDGGRDARMEQGEHDLVREEVSPQVAVASKISPGEITPGAQSALKELESTMQQVKALSKGNEYLDPGVEHVLANVRRIGSGKALPADADVLTQEIAIELSALTSNARILQAEGYLRSAAASFGKEPASKTRGYFAAAADVLGDAQMRGAYHLDDDIEAVQMTLERLSGDVAISATVDSAAVDQLISDLHAHLSDLRGGD